MFIYPATVGKPACRRWQDHQIRFLSGALAKAGLLGRTKGSTRSSNSPSRARHSFSASAASASAIASASIVSLVRLYVGF